MSLAAAETDADTTPLARRTASLHRVVWRWHFYAGLFVAPIVFIAALTGAIYIFRDDVEALLYCREMFVEPRGDRAAWQQAVDAAASYHGEQGRATFLSAFADPNRSAKISVRYGEGRGARSRSLWVDPYSGEVRGEAMHGGFFEIVLSLHRHLFLSTIGRLLVELATSWAIVLFATGVYLWFPRKRSQVAGVWRPRLTAKRYVVLRDLHALGGVYLLPITLTIASTGLVYSSMFGWFYNQGAAATQAFAVFKPPASPSGANAKPLSINDAVTIAKPHFAADSSWSLQLPSKPGEAFLFSEMTPELRQYRRILALDRATGEVLRDLPEHEFPAFLWWSDWNYPLHVGSLLGLPTKLIWLAACLVLMTLPVTGFLMWRERRPPNAWGFPRKLDARLPGWLMAVVALAALLLPAVGLSIAAVLTYERYAAWRARRSSQEPTDVSAVSAD